MHHIFHLQRDSGGVLQQVHRAGVAHPKDPERVYGAPAGLPQGLQRRPHDSKALLAATEEESTGFSAHEDASCITLICQDDVGGLEVLKDGHWVPAEPGGGSIIVNIGDVIKVLSNSKLKSATHQVVSKAAHRHSLSFFSNPHGDRWVEPLPEFLYKEYQGLLVRNKTHPPARHEDVVNITRYAI